MPEMGGLQLTQISFVMLHNKVKFGFVVTTQCLHQAFIILL